MHRRLSVLARIVGVRRRGVAQDADYLAFGQNVAVVQCQKKRLADGERCSGRHLGSKRRACDG